MTSHSGNDLSRKCPGDLETILSLSLGPGTQKNFELLYGPLWISPRMYYGLWDLEKFRVFQVPRPIYGESNFFIILLISSHFLHIISSYFLHISFIILAYLFIFPSCFLHIRGTYKDSELLSSPWDLEKFRAMYIKHVSIAGTSTGISFVCALYYGAWN